ncbi:MAG: hypothetical protein CME62_17670 [Halobacteriovoraceae bacterium]|nr:hypothetical protein [Halobacteriovoraceae bacterium]
MLNRLLLMTFCCALVACAQLTSKSKSAKDMEIDFDVTKKVLDNGLTLLMVEDHKLPIFTFVAYYKVGGKFETPGVTGSSHLLEHMMFKGAKKYGENEFDKLVEGNGGRNNAYTTHDNTVYYESLPSEHINTIIDLEADRMQNLLLAPQSFEKERNVVLEERKMRYENSDRGAIFLKMMQETFKGTPYGNSVIGEVEDLKTISREEVQRYFKQYYAPNNAIIVIVGDIDKDDVYSEIKNRFGKIPAVKNLAEQKKSHIEKQGGFEFKQKFGKRFDLKGQSPNPSFILGYKGVPITNKDGYILDILSGVLGGGASSYLFQNFVTNKKPILSQVYASNYTLQNSGVFFVGGELLQKQPLDQTLSHIKTALNKSCLHAINERSIQKVKNQFLTDTIMGLDTNDAVAKYLGDREFFFGDYNHYKKEMDIYEAITVEEVQKACQEYIKNATPHTFTIWNKNKG